MLLAMLKHIGETIESDPMDVLLQEQKQKLKRVKTILVCDVNLDTGDFSLTEEDFDDNRTKEYLPGIVGGSSHNFSPAISIKTQISSKDKDFSSLPPENILTISKIGNFESFSSDPKSPVHEFGAWLSDMESDLKIEVHDRFQKMYLERSANGVQVVKKSAPRYLFFRFTQGKNQYFPGENEDFVRTYMEIKKKSQKSPSSKDNIVDVCCLGCGAPNEGTISLAKCKFYDFFSLDQLSFSLAFSNSGNQGMVCSNCERAIRQGYAIASTKLRFSAYQIRLSQSKKKYIDHMILPVSDNIDYIRSFIKKVDIFRENSYNKKESSLRKKLEDLNHQLNKLERNKQTEIKKKIKDYQKELNDLSSKDVYTATKWLDEEYLELLREAASRNISVFDLYFEEVTAGSSRKKVVYDMLFGDHLRLRQIVSWLDETDDDFDHEVRFNFNKVFTVFGEKMGRKILQGLFSGKKIKSKDLYKGAYDSIWNMFRDDVKSRNDPQSKYNRYWKYEGPRILHFTLNLLQKAKILGEL